MGRVVAGISVAGPSERFDEESVARYVKLVIDGAARISRVLGHRGLGTSPLQGTDDPGRTIMGEDGTAGTLRGASVE
jgi:hypothetical protein